MAQKPEPTPPRGPSPKPGQPPVPGPRGPRTPYPVDDPGIDDLPGAEPDYLPGTPVQPGRM
jgi:hypothetical protein